MGSKKRILIIHPEGNVFNNPNLHDICLFLGDAYAIDILMPKRQINKNYKFDEESINLIEYQEDICSWKTEHLLWNNFAQILQKYINFRYDLFIGVDALGVIIASQLAKHYKAPYGLISYEIFFTNEMDSEAKNAEIKACEGLDFVIIQDELREKHLLKENRLKLNIPILKVPASSFKSCEYKKSDYLYKTLNIPKDKKILLSIGSITKWSCIDRILGILDNFPPDWVFVVHARYGDSQTVLKNLAKKELNLEKVYFSNEKSKTSEGLKHIIQSADLGFASYCPDFSSIYTGDNIKYIGLASGKISTYLKFGLPIISNAKEYFHISNEKIGYSAENEEEILKILNNFKVDNKLNENCIKVFDKKLDLKNYENEILDIILKSIKNFTKEVI